MCPSLMNLGMCYVQKFNTKLPLHIPRPTSRPTSHAARRTPHHTPHPHHSPTHQSTPTKPHPHKSNKHLTICRIKPEQVDKILQTYVPFKDWVQSILSFSFLPPPLIHPSPITFFSINPSPATFLSNNK
jgi:hypothetical protein